MTQENVQPKKKKWYLTKQAFILYGFVFLLTIVIGTIAEPTSKPQTPAPIPTAEELQAQQEAEQEKEVKREKALQDLDGYLQLFKGRDPFLVTNWRTDGINDDIFVVEVNPDVWGNMLYDQKEKFVGDIGGISDAAGHYSVRVVNNRNRDKLADYRVGRIDIK